MLIFLMLIFLVRDVLLVSLFKEQTEKKTIRRTAARETGGSRHHRVLIQGTPKTHPTSQYWGNEWFKGALNRAPVMLLSVSLTADIIFSCLQTVSHPELLAPDRHMLEKGRHADTWTDN